jgi:hypothetical protein
MLAGQCARILVVVMCALTLVRLWERESVSDAEAARQSMHAEASHDMAALKAAVAASLKREEELKQQLEQIQWLKREEEPKQQLEQMGEARAQGAKEALRRPTPEPAIILVMSSRTDRVRRDAIRETWAKGRRDVKFLVGRYGCEIPPTNRVVPDACEVLTGATESEVQDWTKVTAQVDKGLDEEMQQHNDTLLLDMVDDYRALKLKLGYVWAVQNTDASWIIKTDDDVYLRPAAMQAWFGGPDLQAAPRFTMVASSFNGTATVARQGKRREIKYPLGTWPDFPVGATHAVTRVLAQYVANHVTSLVEYEGEDVSMGVWMALAMFHKELHLRETELFKSYRSDEGAASCILDMEFLSCYQLEIPMAPGSGPLINDRKSPDMGDPTHTGSFGAKEGTVPLVQKTDLVAGLEVQAWEESIDFAPLVPALLPLREDGDRETTNIYTTRAAAAAACAAAGFARLCTKADLEDHSSCAAGWTSDWAGYWMAASSEGCGRRGYNPSTEPWSGPAGAYCCGPVPLSASFDQLGLSKNQVQHALTDCRTQNVSSWEEVHHQISNANSDFFTRAGIKLAVETGMQWYSKGAKKSKYLHRQQQHTFSVTEWFANAGLTDSLLDEAVSKCDEQSVETSEQLRSLQHKGRLLEMFNNSSEILQSSMRTWSEQFSQRCPGRVLKELTDTERQEFANQAEVAGSDWLEYTGVHSVGRGNEWYEGFEKDECIRRCCIKGAACTAWHYTSELGCSFVNSGTAAPAHASSTKPGNLRVILWFVTFDSPGYVYHAKAAIMSAIEKCTIYPIVYLTKSAMESLKPHIGWIRALNSSGDVLLLEHELSFDELLVKLDPKSGQLPVNMCWGRLDIPLIAADLFAKSSLPLLVDRVTSAKSANRNGECGETSFEIWKEHVIYTDSDVLFQNEIDIDGPDARWIQDVRGVAIGPEHQPGTQVNSGVLVFNVNWWLETWPDFLEHAVATNFHSTACEQELIVKYFGGAFTFYTRCFRPKSPCLTSNEEGIPASRQIQLEVLLGTIKRGCYNSLPWYATALFN